MADYFHYDPSFPLALIFFVIFSLSLNLHVYQVVTTRVWFFLPFLLGSLCKCSFHSGQVNRELTMGIHQSRPQHSSVEPSVRKKRPTTR